MVTIVDTMYYIIRLFLRSVKHVGDRGLAERLISTNAAVHSSITSGLLVRRFRLYGKNRVNCISILMITILFECRIVFEFVARARVTCTEYDR